MCKDTVICQMQVVLNLIRNTFAFGSYMSRELEQGQFSLKDVKKDASGHTDSLIPLEKLVMLLQHLNSHLIQIIIKVWSSHPGA